MQKFKTEKKAFWGAPWPGDPKHRFKFVCFKSGALGESLGDLNRTNFDKCSNMFGQFSTFLKLCFEFFLTDFQFF